MTKNKRNNIIRVCMFWVISLPCAVLSQVFNSKPLAVIAVLAGLTAVIWTFFLTFKEEEDE